MTGRHPPIAPARTPTGRTFPSRRTLLRAAVAGTSAAVAAPLVTACGTAAGQPPGKVALHGDNPSWAAPLKAAGEA
ncbi:ABC transporter substrate-binding protein, partial [Streptomyces sp. NPDC056728]